MKTKTKTLTFDQSMKIFKKFVAKSSVRPVLQYVYFDGKYLVATDSHRLLRVNADYITDFPKNMKDTFLYCPKEMTSKNIYMSYPDISRLIPSSSDSTVLINEKNIKDFQGLVKEAKKMLPKDVVRFNLSFTQMDATITVSELKEGEWSEIYSKSIESLYVEGKPISFHVNARYMNDALEAVKKLSKLSSNHVELRISSPIRPIHFKQEDVFDLLVLPIRVY